MSMKLFRLIFLFFLLFQASTGLQAQHDALRQSLRQVISGKAATVGVAVIFNGSELVTVNNMYRYPMMSTFKFHQALAVADYLNKHGETLDTEILVRKADLLPDTYSPLRDANPEGNFTISIGDLLKYTLIESDNNAADILFRHIGGPKAVDRYIRDLGIEDVSIVATEEEMHRSVDNQYLNWTTPSAAALTIETFLQNELCTKDQKLFIQHTMTEAKTGKDKLRAGLPKKNVLLAHKTGSSDRNEWGIKIGDNDMGFVVLPDGRHYTIAVFIMNSRESDTGNAALIARISRLVYEYFSQQPVKE